MNKTCPQCQRQCGVRTLVCPDCQYDFYPDKKIPDYDEETEPGRGKKTCPGDDCGKILAIRTKVCPFCKHEFEKKEASPTIVRKDKERKVIKELDIPSDEDIITPKGVELKEITPKEHAHRVLGYGEKRARALLHTHQKVKCWSHVDWDYVEEELGALL